MFNFSVSSVMAFAFCVQPCHLGAACKCIEPFASFVLSYVPIIHSYRLAHLQKTESKQVLTEDAETDLKRAGSKGRGRGRSGYLHIPTEAGMGSWRPTSPLLLPAAAALGPVDDGGRRRHGRKEGRTASSGGGESGGGGVFWWWRS